MVLRCVRPRQPARRSGPFLRTLTSPGSPALGSTVPADISKDLFAAKVTLKLSQNHTITGTVMGDPNTRTGAVFTTQNGLNFVINGPPSTWQGTLDQGGIDSVGKYDGIFGSKTLVSADARPAP